MRHIGFCFLTFACGIGIAAEAFGQSFGTMARCG
jgi:hypothetical protein